MSEPIKMKETMTSVERGTQWLLSHLQRDGSIKGADNLSYYYKPPFALILAGHNEEAERMLNYIAKTFVKSGGELDGTGVSWWDIYGLYPYGWLAIASLVRGRFELAYSLVKTILSHHDEESGGFFTTADAQRERAGEQGLMSNSIAALACLWAGRLDIARKAGNWMQNLYDAQPDLSKGFYPNWNTRTGLITSFEEDQAKEYLVDCSQTLQYYFNYGIAAAFLSSLAAATGEQRWLKLAQSFLRASQHCSEDVYEIPQSGKIGWGAAWTYRLSGDPADLKLAETIASYLRKTQFPEGNWVNPAAYDPKAPPTPAQHVDITGEFVALLSCMELVIAEAETYPKQPELA